MRYCEVVKPVIVSNDAAVLRLYFYVTRAFYGNTRIIGYLMVDFITCLLVCAHAHLFMRLCARFLFVFVREKRMEQKKRYKRERMK